MTALPPGSEVNYFRWTDDYHCSIGWSEPPSEVKLRPEEMTTETGLRRICSSSGLPMDASWRFLGRTATDQARADDGTVSEYRLRGAGAVLDIDGRVLTEARTLQIGLANDSVTTTHPVVDGVAIVDAWVAPRVAIPLDWDKPPPVEGQVLAADGSVLATCRG